MRAWRRAHGADCGEAARRAGHRVAACAGRSRPRRRSSAAAARAAAAMRPARSGSASRRRSACVQRRGVARRHQLAPPPSPRPRAKPPTSLQQQRRAEGQRGEEHAGLVDLAVGQHDEVGAAEQRRDLGVGHEAGQEAHARRRRGAQRPERPCAACPTTHSSASCDARATPRAARRGPCTGAGGRRTARPGRSVAASSGGSGARLGSAARWVERAVRDHVDLLGVDAELVEQARARRARSARRRRPPARRAAAAPASWPGRGSRGRTSWAVSTQRAVAREQVDVERLHGEPLEVHDVRARARAAVAQHVGHVLGELGRAAQRASPGAPAATR